MRMTCFLYASYELKIHIPHEIQCRYGISYTRQAANARPGSGESPGLRADAGRGVAAEPGERCAVRAKVGGDIVLHSHSIGDQSMRGSDEAKRMELPGKHRKKA